MTEMNSQKLYELLKSTFKSACFDRVKSFAKSPEGGKYLLQWQLLVNLQKSLPNDSDLTEYPDVRWEAMEWLWNDLKALETLLCSGDVLGHKWNEVLQLLMQITSMDPQAIDGWRYRLAVAVALTFSTPVKSLAKPEIDIDPVLRYFSYENWEGMHLLFPVFRSLNAWQMRYVVGSWASDEELLWARDNILQEFKSPNKVGDATNHMIKYRKENHQGISVHNGAEYYDNRPVTLQVLHEVGAVCGGISKFGSAMCQSFGVPALPVGQPGHCAFLWWKEGDWILSNDCSGLDSSMVHDGIQWTWDKNAQYILLMENAQKDHCNYVLSEKLRIATEICSNEISFQLLELASSLCPSNISIWKKWANVCSKVSKGELICSYLQRIFWQDANQILGSELLSRDKPTRVSDCHERGKNIVDGTDSEWWTNKDIAWVEIDLEGSCIVTDVKIQWWGISVSSNYNVFAAGRNGDFEKVKSSCDEIQSPQGYNSWSRLTGWAIKTQQIRFYLKDGMLDPWGKGKFFGIRKIEISGRRESELQVLSSGKAVTASECNEQAHNLVDGRDSVWWAEKESAWIQVDLQRLCHIKYIDLQLLGDAYARDLCITESRDGYTFKLVKRFGAEKCLESNLWKHIPIDMMSRYVRLEICNGGSGQMRIKKFGLRNVVVSGNVCSLSHILVKKAREYLSYFPKVSKDVCKMLIEAEYVLLSENSLCQVSDCHERARNIVDGTSSEWWKEKETAWIKMELKAKGRVCEVKVQWWGTSVSKDMKILAGNDKDKYIQVKQTSDETESPIGYNGWSVFSGWEAGTKFIKFILQNGSLDPWGMKKYFGVRKIVVLGVTL